MAEKQQILFFIDDQHGSANELNVRLQADGLAALPTGNGQFKWDQRSVEVTI